MTPWLRGIVLGALLALAGCGGSGDPLPAAGPDASAPVATPTATPTPAATPAPTPTPAPSPTPSPSPSAAEARLWIEGERVAEPHTLRVTREADAEGNSVRHHFVIAIPGRGWEVRFSLPSASFVRQSRDQDGHVTEERLVEPEREQRHWCMSGGCTEIERPVIERLVMNGVEYGTQGVASQGAVDPCANGSWQVGDPPRAENRQGAIEGVTERLTPTAEGSLYFWGRDDECRENAPYPGLEVDFIAPVAP